MVGDENAHHGLLRGKYDSDESYVDAFVDYADEVEKSLSSFSKGTNNRLIDSNANFERGVKEAIDKVTPDWLLGVITDGNSK